MRCLYMIKKIMLCILFIIVMSFSVSAVGNDDGAKLLVHMDDVWRDNSDTAPTHVITANGDPTFVAGKIDQAGSFDGNDYLSIPNHADFNFGTGDFTIDFWLNAPDVSTTSFVIGKGSSGSDRWILSVADGRFLMTDESGTLVSTSIGLLQTNTWYHLAVVKDSGTLTLYVDGVNQDSNTVGDLTRGGDVTIGTALSGASTYAAYFTGYLDELRISDVARWTSDFSGSLPVNPYTICDGTKTNVDYGSDLYIHISDVHCLALSVTEVANNEIELVMVNGNDVGEVRFIKEDPPLGPANEFPIGQPGDMDDVNGVLDWEVQQVLGQLEAEKDQTFKFGFGDAGDFDEVNIDLLGEVGLSTIDNLDTFFPSGTTDLTFFNSESEEPTAIPEFSSIGIILALAIAGLGIAFVVKKNK